MKRKPRIIPQPITEEELQKIIIEIAKTKGQCSKKFVPLRNIVMFLLGYHLGLRPKEIRCIKISHLNFENTITLQYLNI